MRAIQNRGGRRAWLVLLLAGTAPWWPSAPARAVQEPVATTVRAPKSQLLLPPGFALTVDESHDAAAPERWRTLNVVEGRNDRAFPLETVVSLYQLEGVIPGHQAPSVVSDPLVLRRPGERIRYPLVRTRVYSLVRPAGPLVITTIQDAARGPTRVRVSHLHGNVAPDRAIQITNAFVAGLAVRGAAGQPPVAPANPAPPLPPGAAPHAPVLHVPKTVVPDLLKQVERLPAGVREPLRAIIQQAEGVSIAEYRLPQILPDAEFFRFYQETAMRQNWQPVLENPVKAGLPSVIYRLPGKEGVLFVSGQTRFVQRQLAPGRGAALPTTVLKVIHFQGEIDVARALAPARGNGAGP